MFPVQCFTNLDQWKRAEWPTQTASAPRIGERMQGLMGDKKPILRIVMVTHCVGAKGPYLRVELHN